MYCVWWVARDDLAPGGLGRRRTRPMWDETMISRSICKTAAAVACSSRSVSSSSLCARTRRRLSVFYYNILFYGAAVVRVYYGERDFLILYFLNEPAGYQHATRNRVAEPVPARRFGHHCYSSPDESRARARVAVAVAAVSGGEGVLSVNTKGRPSWGLVVGLP